MSKTITAIIAITFIVGVAILKDFNGALIGTGCALIAGLGGYAMGKKPPREPPSP